MQRAERLRLVQMKQGIVAPWQHRRHVVAEVLVLEMIYDSDGPVTAPSEQGAVGLRSRHQERLVRTERLMQSAARPRVRFALGY